MRHVEVRDEVRLVLVLEVEPYHFSDRSSSSVPWSEYFDLCMADAGFTKVVPIAEGWNFVSARSLIGNPLLERMIHEAADGPDPSAFYGGLALIADGEALISPSCCGDLSDLRWWKQAVVQRPPAGRIWIGHPDLTFSIEADRVTLSEEWESTSPPDWLHQVTMPVTQLTSAFARARAELRLFRRELLPIVTRVLGSSALARRVTNALVGF
jgi:hypothetical protein